MLLELGEFSDSGTWSWSAFLNNNCKLRTVHRSISCANPKFQCIRGPSEKKVVWKKYDMKRRENWRINQKKNKQLGLKRSRTCKSQRSFRGKISKFTNLGSKRMIRARRWKMSLRLEKIFSSKKRCSYLNFNLNSLCRSPYNANYSLSKRLKLMNCLLTNYEFKLQCRIWIWQW